LMSHEILSNFLHRLQESLQIPEWLKIETHTETSNRNNSLFFCHNLRRSTCKMLQVHHE